MAHGRAADTGAHWGVIPKVPRARRERDHARRGWVPWLPMFRWIATLGCITAIASGCQAFDRDEYRRLLDGGRRDGSSADARSDGALDGFADVVPDAPCTEGGTRCAAGCVDTRTDPMNCGTCG